MLFQKMSTPLPQGVGTEQHHCATPLEIPICVHTFSLNLLALTPAPPPPPPHRNFLWLCMVGMDTFWDSTNVTHLCWDHCLKLIKCLGFFPYTTYFQVICRKIKYIISIIIIITMNIIQNLHAQGANIFLRHFCKLDVGYTQFFSSRT